MQAFRRRPFIAPTQPSLRIVIASALLLGVSASAEAQDKPLRGIRFTLDTVEPPAVSHGPLTPFVGAVEFAADRGRIDVTAVRSEPVMAVNGIPIPAPLARPGDYYLFDTTEFILVRPRSRTFTAFPLTRGMVRYGRGIFPGEEMVRPSVQRIDTLRESESTNERSHGAFTLRSHLDRFYRDDHFDQLARAWFEVGDAPIGEATIVRWFGIAKALATFPRSISEIPPDSIRVTALLVVGPLTNGHPRMMVTVGQRIHELRAADIDPKRLALPNGFSESSSRKSNPPPAVHHRPSDTRTKWETLPRPRG